MFAAVWRGAGVLSGKEYQPSEVRTGGMIETDRHTTQQPCLTTATAPRPRHAHCGAAALFIVFRLARISSFTLCQHSVVVNVTLEMKNGCGPHIYLIAHMSGGLAVPLVPDTA